MSRQKAATKTRREMKRSLRKERAGRYEMASVSSFADFTGIEPIGMAKERRDMSPITPRNDAQKLYINSIKHKQLIFANGEAGCGKTYISTALAADALINKDINKIIVTRPVLQAEEDLGFLPGDMADKFAPYFRPVYDVLVKRLGSSFYNTVCGLKLRKLKLRHLLTCVVVRLKMPL